MMEDVLIYLSRDIEKDFSINGTFLSFGKNCDKVKEIYESGGTLVIVRDISSSIVKSKNAAVYVNGKIVFKGSPSIAYKKYRFYVEMLKSNEKLIKINKETLEAIKKLQKPVILKNLKILDENDKERYVFELEEKFKLIIELEPKQDYSLKIMLYRKPDPLSEIEKVGEIFKKVNNGKAEILLDASTITEGEYVFSVSVLSPKKVDFGDNYFELIIRKPV